jgi:hypothetical protein
VKGPAELGSELSRGKCLLHERVHCTKKSIKVCTLSGSGALIKIKDHSVAVSNGHNSGAESGSTEALRKCGEKLLKLR